MTQAHHESGAHHAHDAANTLDWRAWLAGGTPREVLARIVQGDPLELRKRVARKLRSEALLYDADRVQLRVLARCARGAPAYRGRPDLETWLERQVDDALRDLLREDDERSAAASSAIRKAARRTNGGSSTEEATRVRRDAAPGTSGALVELARPLGLDPASLEQACQAFNRLPVADRRAFFLLVLEARDLDQLARGAQPADSKTEPDASAATALARRARRALRTVLEHARPLEGRGDPEPSNEELTQ